MSETAPRGLLHGLVEIQQIKEASGCSWDEAQRQWHEAQRQWIEAQREPRDNVIHVDFAAGRNPKVC